MLLLHLNISKDSRVFQELAKTVISDLIQLYSILATIYMIWLWHEWFSRHATTEEAPKHGFTSSKVKLTSARLPSVAFRAEGAWLWSSATEVILQVSVLICRFCKDEIWWLYFFNGKCIHGSNKHNNHWLHTKCIQDFRIVHRCPRTLIYIVLPQWDFNTGGPVHMLKAPMGD